MLYSACAIVAHTGTLVKGAALSGEGKTRKETEGPGRVKRVVSYLPSELHARIEKLAFKERRTMSTEILLLLEKALRGEGR